MLPNYIKCAILTVLYSMEREEKNTTQASKNDEVMHSFKDGSSGKNMKKMAILFIVVIGLGVGTGFALAKYSATPGNKPIAALPSANNPQKGDIIGSDDTETFSDTAEGVVEEGGIDGEGAYHLVRPGGESQHVYMTSSTVDMSKLIGKKVKVWGQTQAAQTAGWLMDVGRIEVLE